MKPADPFDSNRNKLLAGMFLVFSFGYLLSLPFRPYPLIFIVKSIPIFCLAAFVFLNIEGKAGKLVFIALIFSAIGDISLAIEHPVAGITGILAFMVAHIFYISVFIKEREYTRLRILAVAIVTILTVAYGGFLVASAGWKMLLAMIYLVIIVTMAVSAGLGRLNHPSIFAGAVLFIISDSIIGYNMAIERHPHSSYWIMVTYYSAQAIIVYGALRSRWNESDQ